ncbi:Pectinesterase [Abeliophyllum distichum]|uniref:Pectinesterase n=1 Tax=Abeliophyllum distichum TaxID=126358 RepID=A0ABD1VBM9_9LAMI
MPRHQFCLVKSRRQKTLNPVNYDLSSNPVPENFDSILFKEICDSTDHASLCIGIVVALVDDKMDSFSVLEVSVKGSSELTKLSLSMAQKISNKPGEPPFFAIVKIVMQKLCTISRKQ